MSYALEHLKGKYAAEFRTALGEALRALDSEARLALKL
jgi:hypothetical protein